MNLKLFSVGITSIKLQPNSQNKAGLLFTRRQLNEHRIKLITACCLLASQLLQSLVARSPRVKKNKCLKETNGKTHWESEVILYPASEYINAPQDMYFAQTSINKSWVLLENITIKFFQQLCFFFCYICTWTMIPCVTAVTADHEPGNQSISNCWSVCSL